MKTPRPAATPSVRQIGDAKGLHAGTDWLMAALLFAAAAAVTFYFRVPFKFDFESPDFNPLVFVPLFLGGFGLKSFVSALVATWRGRKHGECVFEMEGETVAPGEMLRGRIRTATELQPTGDYEIWIRCIEATEIDTLKVGERRTVDHIRWEGRVRVDPGSVRSTAGIPFEFALPDSALAIGDPAAQGSVRWTLEIRAPEPGLDFYALFGVDVRHRS